MSITDSVQSVDRAFLLLETLEAARTPLAVSDLVRETGLAAGTVHRLLQTLRSLRVVRQNTDRRYTLGIRLSALGAAATAMGARDAETVLRRIARDVGETTNLATLVGDAAEYIAQVQGTHSMRMFTEVGHRVPLHATGVGKALLSQLSDGDALRILHRAPMRAFTPTTIDSPAAMQAELVRIRERGYAIDEGEMEVGVRCVAMPFVVSGRAFAVSVSGPAPRMTDAKVTSSAAALAAARDRLVNAVGDD